MEQSRKREVLELKLAIIEAEALMTRRLMEYVRDNGIPDKELIEEVDTMDFVSCFLGQENNNSEECKQEDVTQKLDIGLYNQVLKASLEIIKGLCIKQ